MTNLKEYIDFAVTLTEMEEVKNNKFPLPSEISFKLNHFEHSALQVQVHDAKGLDRESLEHKKEFTIEIFGIDFKFIEK
jgi:hypothetical protein